MATVEDQTFGRGEQRNNAFLKDLRVNGRFPKVELKITPLEPRSKQPRAISKTVVIDKFISYQFTNNMLVPVDSFSYSFTAPNDEKPFTDYVLEGDLISLYANNVVIGTGIVDQIEIECDGDNGEKVTVNGRNLLGQLEDQSCVDINMKPIYMENIKITAAIQKIIEGTRIPREIIEIDTPSILSLIQTEPGESKLSAILRFLEPVNCLLWASPEGRLVVGKPNMGQSPVGKMMINREKRSSNVLSMRVVKSAASIPSRYVVLWTAREASVQYAVKANNVYDNLAEGPKRLLKNGHSVIKTIVSSLPNGADAAGADAITRQNNALKAGTSLLEQYAFRQIAKENFNETLVTCVVAGHYNEKGEPYRNDTVYNIEYDRAGLNENMYLYSVEFQGTNERGQWTILSFCKLGTIVEGAKVNKGNTNNA